MRRSLRPCRNWRDGSGYRRRGRGTWHRRGSERCGDHVGTWHCRRCRGWAAAGPAVLGAMPALASVGVMQLVQRDDESLSEGERAARRDGRVASWVGAGGATAGGVAAISGLGAVGGLSGAGIASGLATIGGVMGGGMAIGATAVVAAAAVAAAAPGTGVFLVARRLRNRKHKGRD
jgi:hypothetical protein